jgi:5-methylcytosine-specific restriction endonuclease McrA
VARQIRERDGHACVYCGATEQSSGAHLHFDHLTPKSAGGLDAATNLVMACRSCNSRRHDMSLSVWAREAHQMQFTARSIRAQARKRLPEVA